MSQPQQTLLGLLKKIQGGTILMLIFIKFATILNVVADLNKWSRLQDKSIQA